MRLRLVGLDQQHNCPGVRTLVRFDIRQTWTFASFAFWLILMPGLASAAAVGLIGLYRRRRRAWGWSLWIGVLPSLGACSAMGLRVYRVLQVIGALILPEACCSRHLDEPRRHLQHVFALSS